MPFNKIWVGFIIWLVSIVLSWQEAFLSLNSKWQTQFPIYPCRVWSFPNYESSVNLTNTISGAEVSIAPPRTHPPPNCILSPHVVALVWWPFSLYLFSTITRPSQIDYIFYTDFQVKFIKIFHVTTGKTLNWQLNCRLFPIRMALRLNNKLFWNLHYLSNNCETQVIDSISFKKKTKIKYRPG